MEYAVTGGTAVTNRDFVLKNGTLVFKPGETSKSIDMRIIDDGIYNENKTIEVTLSKPVNAVLGKQTVHTYTIVESDPPPSVTFASPTQDVREVDGEVTISVRLSPVSGKDVIVPFTVSGTAIDGKNYRVMTPSPLTIRAGETTGAITLSLMDNKLYEDNKVIFVSIGAPVNATPGAHPVHRVAVLESDPPPVVGFLAKDPLGEDGQGPAKINVVLSMVSGRRTTVEYAIAGGSAAHAKDHTRTGGMLVFEPGETVKTIDTGIIDDKLLKDNETIEWTLSNPVNATLGNIRVYKHTVIRQTDTASRSAAIEKLSPAVGFVASGSAGYEKKGPAKTSVSLSAASNKQITVEYAVTGGTAVNNKNFVLKNGTLVFKPGETSKSIDMRIIDDRIYNENRTIEVTLSKPVNAVLGKQTVHTYTIVESDPPPAVTFASPTQDVREADGEITISVKLSPVSGKDVIVPFIVSGTAIDREELPGHDPGPAHHQGRGNDRRYHPGPHG